MTEAMDVITEAHIANGQGGTTAPMAGAVGAAVDHDPRVPSERLMGFGGRMILKQCVQLIQSGEIGIMEFVSSFRAMHSMKAPSCEPMLDLMDMGGLGRSRVGRMLLSLLTNHYKQKIPELSQPHLKQLLDESYSFLTVPELKPIAIAALERLEDVPDKTWEDIVENGMTESPYIDMPVTIKRRIWLALPESWNHEIDVELANVKEFADPDTHTEYMVVGEREKHRLENEILQRVLKLLGNNDQLLVGFIDRMVEKAAMCSSIPLRQAYANLFHDVLASLSARFMPNVEKLRSMAKYLDKGGTGNKLELQELREIRDALSENASCGPVALLVSSVYTRDLVILTLIQNLMDHKKNPCSQDDKVSLKTLGGELERDQTLENLTYICLSNICTHRVLSENAPLESSQTAKYYAEFYPRLCHLMARDDESQRSGFIDVDEQPVHSMFMDMANEGSFERRVICAYALECIKVSNLVGLSKLRLVLDRVFASASNVEEKREMVISQNAVMIATEW